MLGRPFPVAVAAGALGSGGSKTGGAQYVEEATASETTLELIVRSGSLAYAAGGSSAYSIQPSVSALRFPIDLLLISLRNQAASANRLFPSAKNGFDETKYRDGIARSSPRVRPSPHRAARGPTDKVGGTVKKSTSFLSL